MMSGGTWQISAMKDAHIGVAAVCMAKSYVVFENGLQLPIYGYLDADRQPIGMDDECFYEDIQYYEFGDEDHGFGIGNIDDYEMPSYMDH